MIFETTNLTDQTVRRLMKMIGDSGLKPGQAFAREGDLEKKLKVSRPVLREAVSRLRALGILRSRQCVGLIIAKPDPVELFGAPLQSWSADALDLSELAELRYTLEIGAVELAARRATPEQLQRLMELAEEFDRFKPGKSVTRSIDDIELDFHRTILEATHNSTLTRMHHILAVYFLRSQREVPGWDLSGTDINTRWEHRAIAQALIDRNAERARVILTGHLRTCIRSQDSGFGHTPCPPQSIPSK